MHVIAQSEETQGIAPSHEHQPAEVNLSSSSGRSSDLLYQTWRHHKQIWNYATRRPELRIVNCVDSDFVPEWVNSSDCLYGDPLWWNPFLNRGATWLFFTWIGRDSPKLIRNLWAVPELRYENQVRPNPDQGPWILVLSKPGYARPSFQSAPNTPTPIGFRGYLVQKRNWKVQKKLKGRQGLSMQKLEVKKVWIFKYM